MSKETETELHKHQESTYTICFFDMFGRHVKGKDSLESTLSEAINKGNDTLLENEELESFVVKRTLYNSKQRSRESKIRY